MACKTLQKNIPEKFEMLKKFNEIIDDGFDYEESLKRQKIKQQDVESLRARAKFLSVVPRTISDKHVSAKDIVEGKSLKKQMMLPNLVGSVHKSYKR